MKKNCNINVFIVSIVVLLIPLSVSGEDIFIEDFLTNSNNWPIADDEEVATDIVAGSYSFEYKSDDAAYYVWYPIPIDTNRDFEIKSKMYHSTGRDDRGYGLVWGMKDVSNYYTFNITNNGYYRISELKNGEWYDLIPWTESDCINTYSLSNVLTIKKLGDTYYFYINNLRVDEMNFRSFFGDQIGYVIFMSQKIMIDYLHVRYIEEMQTLMNEQFTDNSLGWAEANDASVYAGISGGYYNFEHKNEEDSYYVWNSVALNDEEDFQISSTLTHVSGIDNYGYGLVWGMKDLENCYTFDISDNGYYRFGKFDNDEWSNLIDWTSSDLLRSGNATNTLTIDRIGTYYHFYINGEWQDSFEFEPFFGNRIGFVIWRNQFIKIDELVVKQEGFESSSILNQARDLLAFVTVEEPDYMSTYQYLADSYWERAEESQVDSNHVETINLYQRSAKAEVLSESPRLPYIADALARAAKSMNKLGKETDEWSYYLSAQDYWEVVLEIDETLGDHEHVVTDLINIGVTYNNINEYDTAIKYYKRALAKAEEINDDLGIFEVYDHIGWTFENASKFEDAIASYQEAVDYAESIDNIEEMMLFWELIATVYDLCTFETEKAILYYEKAVTAADQLGNIDDKQRYLYYIGDSYYLLGEEEIAEKYWNEADKISLDEGDK